jgi:hypothetical protein
VPYTDENLLLYRNPAIEKVPKDSSPSIVVVIALFIDLSALNSSISLKLISLKLYTALLDTGYVYRPIARRRHWHEH